jgi:two-component system NarL family sensor kinase
MIWSRFNQIKWKLTLMILGTSVVVLGLGCIAVLVYDAVESKRHLLSRVETMAEITAANSSAAMAFNNEVDAQETLSPLRNRADIDLAGLFFPDGSAFVLYTNEQASVDLIRPLDNRHEGHRFDGERLILKRRVMFRENPDPVGYIIICANLREQSARSNAFLLIAALAMSGLIGVALLLGGRLQRMVSEPIAQLAEAANDITLERDYSIRVQKNSNDEVGSLVDAFNTMLTEIERQNHNLMESENRLKLALSASNMGTWEWDLATSQIACSAETRRIFGCPTHDADLSLFSKLLHPEDSECVMAALHDSAAHNTLFNAEYRVSTPDGRVVWVAHLGRLQHHADGKPARLASIVQDITARKHADTERQKLIASMLHAEEDERRRIARELHDTTAQHLAALKINFVRLCEQADLSDTVHETLAVQGRQLLDQALHELRTLTYILHPPVLEQFGLVGALSDFASGITRRNGVNVTLKAGGYRGRLSPTIELTLFRVVQEGVTNAIRHSGTKQIVIHLTKDAKEVRLAVEDFGRGMPERATSLLNAGVGIGSMKERLSLIGGRLSVDSGQPGVTIRATVPIPATIPAPKES